MMDNIIVLVNFCQEVTAFEPLLQEFGFMAGHHPHDDHALQPF
jgi:hypothetical protein